MISLIKSNTATASNEESATNSRSPSMDCARAVGYAPENFLRAALFPKHGKQSKIRSLEHSNLVKVRKCDIECFFVWAREQRRRM